MDLNRETKVYSVDETKNSEFIEFFVKKYKLQQLKSMYLNVSSYYYDSQESILYCVQHGFSKYKAHLIFQIITDDQLLAHNGIKSCRDDKIGEIYKMHW